MVGNRIREGLKKISSSDVVIDVGTKTKNICDAVLIKLLKLKIKLNKQDQISINNYLSQSSLQGESLIKKISKL